MENELPVVEIKKTEEIKQEKPEEKKNEPALVLDPKKKLQEIMIHLDDISLILGKGVHPNKEYYVACEDYMKDLHIAQDNELAILPTMRIGVNGINLYAYMTCACLKLETHIFRFYVKDLQVKPQGHKLRDIVDDKFEYVCCNHEVELVTERRIGDNYSAFKNNYEFFKCSEESNLFKEKINQLDVDFEMIYNPSKSVLKIIAGEMTSNLNHHCMNPAMYLMAKVNSDVPSPVKVPSDPVVVKPQIVAPTKESSSFSLEAYIKGIYLIIPMNVYFLLIFSAKMEILLFVKWDYRLMLKAKQRMMLYQEILQQ